MSAQEFVIWLRGFLAGRPSLDETEIKYVIDELGNVPSGPGPAPKEDPPPRPARPNPLGGLSR